MVSTWYSSHPGGICIAAAGGSEPRCRVLSGNGLVGHMVWAPDGRSVFLTEYTSDCSWSECERPRALILQLDVASMQLTAPTHAPLQEWPLPLGISVSPDGTTLAVATGSDVWLMRPDGSDARRRTVARTPAEQVYAIEWSPSGTRLALTMGDVSNCGIRCTWFVATMSVVGATLHELYAMPGESYRSLGQPYWSPDEQILAVTRNCYGDEDAECAQDILGIPTNGGKTQMLLRFAEARGWRR